MPTIRWPAPQNPPLASEPGPDFVATSLHQSVLLEGVSEIWEPGTRLRLFRFGELVWQRWLRATEPRPLRAFVHDTGLSVLIGEGFCSHWLSILDPRSGHLTRVTGLDSIAGPSRSDGLEGDRGWLRFCTAGFVELPGRGVCFSLRTAPGPRILVDPRRGSFVPGAEEEELLATHEAEGALAALAEAESCEGQEPFLRPVAAQERLGAATLVAAEQGLQGAKCALRTLEWGGGPCRPGLRRPGDVNPALADMFDLRRLAQRALLSLGERPRPLPGARVIRVGPQAALHASLEARASAALDLCSASSDRLTPLKVLARAGQPDDVGPAHWDYGIYAGRLATLRISWSRPLWGQVPRLEGVKLLPVWAATSSYRGLEEPLDPLAA